jgi:hypothetical protein
MQQQRQHRRQHQEAKFVLLLQESAVFELLFMGNIELLLLQQELREPLHHQEL